MSAIVYDEPYKYPAGILAIAVHGAFFALLYFGFTWQAQPVATMSVELWQSLPSPVSRPPEQLPIEKAAQPPQPEKIARPEVVPPPEKTVVPEITMPDKKKEKPKPIEVKPDKKKKESKPVEVKPDKKKPAPAPEKKVESKPEKRELEARIVEQIALEQVERAAREQTERAERARAEQAAATGRMVDEYTGKIISKIRRNIVMPPDVAEDARAEFLVTLLPGGTVLSARLTRPSGNVAYDNAVERAILKSQPLPLPADVALFNKFRKLELVFRPVE